MLYARLYFRDFIFGADSSNLEASVSTQPAGGVHGIDQVDRLEGVRVHFARG